MNLFQWFQKDATSHPDQNTIRQTYLQVHGISKTFFKQASICRIAEGER
jgi:hypothetical protein